LSIPNYLTLLRIILTPVFITSLISYSPEKEYLRYWALAIFALAGLTDALDGILARVLRQKTALGEILDPLADKLLLLSGYISLLFVDSVLYPAALDHDSHYFSGRGSLDRIFHPPFPSSPI